MSVDEKLVLSTCIHGLVSMSLVLLNIGEVRLRSYNS